MHAGRRLRRVHLYTNPVPEKPCGARNAGVELRIAPPDQTSVGLSEAHGQPSGGPPPNDYYFSLGPAAQERYADALYGGGDATGINGAPSAPPAGCLTSAEQELYQSDDYIQLDSQRATLIAGIGPAVLSDSEFQTLLADYKICMQDKGFDPGAPWDAWVWYRPDLMKSESPPNRPPSKRRSPPQTATANNRSTTRFAQPPSTTAFVQGIVEDNAGLDQLVQIEHDALARAKQLL